MLLCVVLAGAGLVGVYQYVDTFWLYRGFAAPAQVKSIVVGTGPSAHVVTVHKGLVETIGVKSPALGGREVPVIVYLPPGYATHPHKRYPVFYLLHGFPGAPQQFIDVGDLATYSDTLLARGQIQPMICVMPSGAPSFLVDEEWANTIQPNSAWESFVAHDLVSAINTKFRTLKQGAKTGLGGLSEGAYGAINIGLHHAGEFGLIEGWSPYYSADPTPSLFGDRKALMAYNSPMVYLPQVASQLRKTHTYFWLYDGIVEVERRSLQFVALLTKLHIANKWSRFPGKHNWGLWRPEMPKALIAASDFFEHGAPTQS